MLDIILFVLSDFLVYVIAVYLLDWSADLIERVSLENRVLSFCRSSIRLFAKKNSNKKKKKYLRFSLRIDYICFYILRFTNFEIKNIISNIDEIFSSSYYEVEKWLFLILHDQKSILRSSKFVFHVSI